MAVMRAGIYYSNSDVRVEEVPRPEAAAGEVLVRVRASGICGSDVLEWYRIKKAPLVLGHEIAGVIEKTGPGVKGLSPGDRVFVSHHVPCNTCRSCLRGNHTACRTLHSTNFDPGGFAEFVRVPPLQTQTGVFTIPEGMRFDEGTLIEPLACVLRAQRLAGIDAGDRVLVLGAGMSGMLHVALAAARGASSVTAVDINPWRLEQSLRFGADHALAAGEDLPERYAALHDDDLADLVIVSTGAPAAVNQSMLLVGNGGTVLFFGAPDPDLQATIPFHEIWKREVTLKTSYGAAPKDFPGAIDLIANRRIPAGDMITHRFGLDDIGEAFRVVTAGGESLKVIVTMP